MADSGKTRAMLTTSRLATLPIMTYKSGTSGAGISARAGRFAKNLPQGA
jgi:hypothetical protein